ncbi:MAG: hypothetical protein P4L98_24820 [Ancalomicrobiaceae bacterium]|nr:hypothetical protein [Ancalomicrobiaceae bacterium]
MIHRDDRLVFRDLDMTKDELPHGDVAFVRQVLQHLSNADITSFVGQLHAQRPYRYLIVTEHVPAMPSFRPNVDKYTGPSERTLLDSGVDLAKPPFNLAFVDKTQLLELPFQFGGLIRTTLYRLR